MPGLKNPKFQTWRRERPKILCHLGGISSLSVAISKTQFFPSWNRNLNPRLRFDISKFPLSAQMDCRDWTYIHTLFKPTALKSWNLSWKNKSTNDMEAIHPYGQNSKSLANEFCQTKRPWLVPKFRHVSWQIKRAATVADNACSIGLEEHSDMLFVVELVLLDTARPWKQNKIRIYWKNYALTVAWAIWWFD